jgi:hypothetical protein
MLVWVVRKMLHMHTLLKYKIENVKTIDKSGKHSFQEKLTYDMYVVKKRYYRNSISIV